MRTRLLVLVGVLAVAAGCSKAALIEEEVPAIRQVVEATNEELATCFSEADAGCLAGFFAPDGWQMRSNTPALASQSAIQKYWQQNLGGGQWELALEAMTVEESGPIAVERGTYSLSFTADPEAPTLRTSFLEKGRYLTYWRLDMTGRWFIVVQALTAEVTGRTQ